MNRILASITALLLVASAALAQDAKPGLDAYKATFKMAENPYIKKIIIDAKEGKLVATSDARPDDAIELTKTALADSFLAKIQSYDADFVFRRSQSGEIQSLKISVAGGMMVFTGEKEGNDYASAYNMAENQYCKQIFIKEKDGKLYMAADTNPNDMVELSNKAADVYTASVQGYDAEISFTRKEGKVASIKISVAGGQVVLTGEKDTKN